MSTSRAHLTYRTSSLYYHGCRFILSSLKLLLHCLVSSGTCQIISHLVLLSGFPPPRKEGFPPLSKRESGVPHRNRGFPHLVVLKEGVPPPSSRRWERGVSPHLIVDKHTIDHMKQGSFPSTSPFRGKPA